MNSKNAWFAGRKFYVLKNIYIPHPETEFIFTLLSKIYKPGMSILEVGSGTGCICITISIDLRAESIYACELDIHAYINTRINCIRYNAQVDLLNIPIKNLQREVDIIISNPPYIKTSLVSDFKRQRALDGGDDGLDIVRQIVDKEAKYIILELGYADQIKYLSQLRNYIVVEYIKPIDNYEVYFILLARSY